MYRTHTCGELRITEIKKEVTLSGWVQTVRKFGSITFVDLRDRYGITQLLFNESLNKQLDAPALSADAKTQKAKERDDKIANIKNMEREINEFRQTRERQLQEQALRMREGIVKEISDVVNEKVKANSMDLVFDKSGMSLNGVPILLFAKDNYDFTNDVVAVLNKPGRATSLTTTAPIPAASASASPAKKP